MNNNICSNYKGWALKAVLSSLNQSINNRPDHEKSWFSDNVIFCSVPLLIKGRLSLGQKAIVFTPQEKNILNDYILAIPYVSIDIVQIFILKCNTSFKNYLRLNIDQETNTGDLIFLFIKTQYNDLNFLDKKIDDRCTSLNQSQNEFSKYKIQNFTENVDVINYFEHQKTNVANTHYKLLQNYLIYLLVTLNFTNSIQAYLIDYFVKYFILLQYYFLINEKDFSLVLNICKIIILAIIANFNQKYMFLIFYSLTQKLINFVVNTLKNSNKEKIQHFIVPLVYHYKTDIFTYKTFDQEINQSTNKNEQKEYNAMQHKCKSIEKQNKINNFIFYVDNYKVAKTILQRIERQKMYCKNDIIRQTFASAVNSDYLIQKIIQMSGKRNYNCKNFETNIDIKFNVSFDFNLNNNYNLVTYKIAYELSNYLLPSIRLRTWTLLYDSNSHGVSIKTFFKYSTTHFPSIVVLRTNDEIIIGGFSPKGISEKKRFYGSSDCFVFKINPKQESKLSVYTCIGTNECCIHSNADGLLFGYA